MKHWIINRIWGAYVRCQLMMWCNVRLFANQHDAIAYAQHTQSTDTNASGLVSRWNFCAFFFVRCMFLCVSHVDTAFGNIWCIVCCRHEKIEFFPSHRSESAYLCVRGREWKEGTEWNHIGMGINAITYCTDILFIRRDKWQQSQWLCLCVWKIIILNFACDFVFAVAVTAAAVHHVAAIFIVAALIVFVVDRVVHLLLWHWL